MKKIIKITLVIIFLIPVLGFMLILIWGMPGMSFEVPGYKLTETYLTMGDYPIGKQKFQYNICHKKEGCMEGKILGLKEKNNDIYVYYKVNNGSGYTIDSNNEKINFYGFTLYKKDKNRTTVYNLNDLPKYLYLSDSILKIYSENDLEKLDKEKQNIFKELINNPKIIVDGKEYE